MDPYAAKSSTEATPQEKLDIFNVREMTKFYITLMVSLRA